MARPTVNITQEDISSAKAANSFDPVPKGRYVGTIRAVELRTFEGEKKERYIKERGTNEYYNVQLQIVGATANKRIVFAMIPFFTHWLSSEKHPKGWPTQLIPFFEALGYELDGEFTIPEPDELAGKPIGFVVGIQDNVNPKTGEKTKQNSINGYFVASEEDLDTALDELSAQDEFDV